MTTAGSSCRACMQAAAVTEVRPTNLAERQTGSREASSRELREAHRGTQQDGDRLVQLAEELGAAFSGLGP